jgi:hypothetical protein
MYKDMKSKIREFDGIPGSPEPGRPFMFKTSCLYARGKDILDMRDHPKCQRVTYKTFRKHCSHVLKWAELMGYDRKIPLSREENAVFYKSFYCGRPCYYIEHSRIEFIWVKKRALLR